jgi:tRNA threonylcarbamoyladenosine biosynthesis protein TsaB
MRALRVALKKPLVGLTTLEAMAAAAQSETGLALAASLHDARRGEVYLQILRGRESLIDCIVLPFEAALTRLGEFAAREKIALAGTAAEAAGTQIPGTVLSSIRQPDALWVARLARDVPVSDTPPAPLYLRAPDAKLPA